jgi:GH18 family chitinase
VHYLLLDNYVLLSIVNMKLRDYYSSLEDLCENMGINRQKLEDKLAQVGYCYNKDTNQFISVI